jgi:type IV pilus assembly protein PilQ
VLSQVDGLNIIADDAIEAKKSLTINVKNVPLKEVLSYIARNMGVAFYLGENIVWVTESPEEPGSGPKLETRIFQLRQGFIPTLKPQGGGDQGGGEGGQASEDDTDLEDALDAFLADSPEGSSYRVFKTRNILVVRDTRENLRTVEELVKTFDKPPYQVRIEARFITIGQADLYDVGSELSLTPDTAPVAGDAETQLQVTDLLTSLGALQMDNKDGVGYADLGGVLGNRAYSLVISALDRRASTKNLSAPRVTVLNNHSARIRRGKTTLYYSELDTVASTATSTTGDSNSSIQTAFTGTPDELETGVTLDVKVNVGNDGQTVLLGLKPEIIELSQWRSFNVIAGGDSNSNNNTTDSTTNAQGNIELPETSESTLQTAVAIHSGQTVALGGLVTSTVQKTVSKVPILGDIPLLGFFFRHTSETNEPQHLLIFVTARVIDQDGNFVRVAE